MDATTTRETLGFQAEVKQLLHLMVHSLYGNKEIFLRELVSNASDAGDKLRFEALADGALFENDPELKIRVSVDPAARTITISDNGIGMSRQEVIEHIGTIAKSGTREFFEQLASDRAKDANLIGQFGVGFYSAFIVSDRVTLVTRRAGLGPEHGVRWESTGEGEYTVETVTKESRGTDVILHLRPEEDELLSGDRLRAILRKYSDHITVPILMKKETWDTAAKKLVVTENDEQVVGRTCSSLSVTTCFFAAVSHVSFFIRMGTSCRRNISQDGAQAIAREQLVLLWSEVEDHIGPPRLFCDRLDGVLAFAGAFPAHAMLRAQAGAARHERHPIRHDER